MLQKLEKMIEEDKMDSIKRWAKHIVATISRKEVQELHKLLGRVLHDTNPHLGSSFEEEVLSETK